MTKNEIEKQIESQMKDDTNMSEFICKTMKKKPVIAQEVIENVYFKNSSESNSDCLERINFLISSSQQKLIEYQKNNNCHVPWGLPITTKPKRQSNDQSLLKERTPISKFKNYLRKQKVPAPTVLNQEQYEFICSDSESNAISPNESDDEWSQFEEKGKIKKALKRKSITVERVPQNSDNKSKRNKVPVNKGKKSPTPDLLIEEIPKVVALPAQVIGQIENILTEESKLENKIIGDIRIIEKTAAPSKSFRKSFQIKPVHDSSNIDDTELNKKDDSSDEFVSVEETKSNRLKRSLEKDTNFRNNCDEKKLKLSENIATGSVSPTSQDIFSIDDDEPEIKENMPKPGSSKEMNDVQTEGSISITETSLKEIKKPEDNLEVTIINDITCPICDQPFSMKDIEVHASDCDGIPALVSDECDAIFERRLRNTSRR